MEQVERLEATDRQMLAALVAAGADAQIPEAGSYRAEFDTLLAEEPSPESPRAAYLRRAGG